jgi:branched-chain amino acid transport system permease protein
MDRVHEAGMKEFFRKNLSVIGLAALLAVYQVADSSIGIGLLSDMVTIMIFAILALGLNVTVGFVGLLNLCCAAFFAIGAYTAGILTSPIYPYQLSFWSVLVVAPFVAAAAGMLLGAPSLRLRGDYLAIVTLGFGEMLQVTLKNLESVTQGTKGINPVAAPTVGAREFYSADIEFWFYLAAGALILVVWILRNLERSRIGRAWVAVREDELAAGSIGINPFRAKMAAFAIGSAIAGFAGVLHAGYLQSTTEPGNFDFVLSVMVLCMVVIGGLGSIYGTLLGAALIMGIDRVLLPRVTDWMRGAPGGSTSFFLDFNNWKWALFGLALVVMTRIRPEGLLPSKRLRLELRKTKNAGDE